jgi:5-methylcytosine-specific restriction enzyme subunit McrC
LATVLINGTRHLMRRGVDRGYIPRYEDISCLKGRVMFAETLGRNLTERGIAHCEFDELDYNVLHNQILKTTLSNLSQTDEVDPVLSHQLANLVRRFPEVNLIRLSRLTFRKLQITRNNAFYNFLMKVCELVQGMLLPEESSGRFRLRDILRDEKQMSRIFQAFVFNFYRLEQRVFEVRSDRIQWDVDLGYGSGRTMLPSMLTDVSLRSKEKTLVIDTKYTPQTFQNYKGSETVRSPHLYQIFSYLKNLEKRGGTDAKAEGLLLYPTASKEADLSFRVQGHPVRVSTLDLSRDWSEIRQNLLGLLGLPNSGQ